MTQSDDSKNTPCYRWFECNDVVIALDLNTTDAITDLGLEASQQAPVADLIDAVLLAEHEPLLQCLSALRGEDLDWKPVKSASVDSTVLHEITHLPRITAMLRLVEGIERTVYLAIPVEELESMPEIPEQWRSLVELNVCAYQFHPCIQSMVLSDDELKKLSSGSMVLVSASYDSDWSVSVTSVDELEGSANGFLNTIMASIDCENDAIRVHPRASDEGVDTLASAGLNQTRLLLKERIVINQLYAESVWRSGMNVVLKLVSGLDGAEVRVMQQSSADQGPIEYLGALMRVGKGYGVLVNEKID